MLEVLAFLAVLREVHPDMARWGLRGGCFRVFLLLQQRFPTAEAWYDGNHVITRVGIRFFDITGEVEPGSHLPMAPAELEEARTWATLPHAFACPPGFLMVHQDLVRDLMDQEPLNADQQSRLQKCLEVANG